MKLYDIDISLTRGQWNMSMVPLKVSSQPPLLLLSNKLK
nr:MAG TPA: hypothetical protein [Caudoviricetes sp.]